MEWVETTGRTVDEAKEAALAALGIGPDDAEFDVVEEPRPGLFGRVRGEARVRARVRPTSPRPKEDRRDRRRRQRGGRDTDGSSDAPPSAGADTDDADEKVEEEAGSGRGGGRRRSGGGRAATVTATVQRNQVEQDDREDGMSDEEGSEDVPLSVQAESAEEFVEGLVDQFGLRAEVSSEILDEDHLEVRVNGEDLGILIGPRGNTLAAIQELTRTVVQRRLKARHGRILVDVAGYRQKRKVALERFTQQLAAEVKETGQRRVLEPMTPADRKIVHDTANNIDGVSTTSEGEEPRRRVVILPASS